MPSSTPRSYGSSINNADILRTLRAAAAARDRKDYVIGLAALHRSRLRIDAIERRLGLSRCAGP